MTVDPQPRVTAPAQTREPPPQRELPVLTGGHPFDAPAFDALLGSLQGWRPRLLAHPDAEAAIGAGAARACDAVLFYDMAGYRFRRGTVEMRAPSADFQREILALTERGAGIVCLHHALASWAAWPEWSEIVGGRFLYRPDTVRGRARPDSGYRADVQYTVEAVGAHPITAGLPARFELRDEPYLAEVYADDVTPLLRARHGLAPDDFLSAAAAVRALGGSAEDARREQARAVAAGWRHDAVNELVGWTRTYRRSRVVYLQFGDGPSAYAHPQVRALLQRALDWAAARDPEPGTRA